MGNQYGPYVMYFLSQLLQKQRAGARRGGHAGVIGTRAGSCTAGRESKGDHAGADGRRRAAAGGGTAGAARHFDADETGAVWHRQTQIALLAQFCPEGAAQAEKHGHFLIGQKGSESFVAVPGRFLRDEQPAGGATGFTLCSRYAAARRCMRILRIWRMR